MNICAAAHVRLDHFHPLSPDLGDDGGDVDHTLILCLLQGNVQGDERPTATHTRTEQGDNDNLFG